MTSRTLSLALTVPLVLAAVFPGNIRAQIPGKEIHRLFLQDQKDRRQNPQGMSDEQQGTWWAGVRQRDAQRRTRTLELLRENLLTTGQDFEDAAFIFQHGEQADDYLLAHVLATVAVAKGHGSARWIAAATLDRYLTNTGKPQVFGTQYSSRAETEGKWTQEPYNRALIPDALRNAMCVPATAIQAKVLDQMNGGKEGKPYHIDGCK